MVLTICTIDTFRSSFVGYINHFNHFNFKKNPMFTTLNHVAVSFDLYLRY